MIGSGRGKPSRFFVLAGCLLLVLASACTSSPSKGPPPEASSEGSVLAFGAKGDGIADDTAAIQAALDSIPAGGGRILVPAGTYRISAPLVVRRNGLTLRGEGPSSVLKLADGVTRTMFVLPVEFGPSVNSADVVVTDVELSRLTLDGNRNGRAQVPPTFFAMHLLHAQRVTLSELVVKDWPFDGITIGVGQRPNRDVTIRNSRFSGMGRNAIHVGYGSNVRISQVFVDDTPSQQWGPAAGSAIDVEVEGQDSFVDGLVVEDSFFQRMGTRTAGFGLGLQPAYGPIRNAAITRNVFRNHQTGVFVGKADGVVVTDNWILDDDSLVSGHGMFIHEGTPKLEANVLNLLRWPGAASAVWVDRASAPQSVARNVFWGGGCTLRLNGGSTNVPITGNQWGNASGCFLDPASPSERAAQSENPRVTLGALDQEAPSVRLDPPARPVVSSPTKVRATVADRGAGVARVFFLVDGIPAGFSDTAPYELLLDPSGVAEGQRTIEALAVDKAANVSSMSSLTVEVRR